MTILARLHIGDIVCLLGQGRRMLVVDVSGMVVTCAWRVDPASSKSTAEMEIVRSQLVLIKRASA